MEKCFACKEKEAVEHSDEIFGQGGKPLCKECCQEAVKMYASFMMTREEAILENGGSYCLTGPLHFKDGVLLPVEGGGCPDCNEFDEMEGECKNSKIFKEEA